MEWAHKTLDWITDRTIDVTISRFNRSPFWLPYWQKLCCWTTGPAISTIRSILPERPKPVEVDYGDIEWGDDGPYEGQPTIVEWYTNFGLSRLPITRKLFEGLF